MLEMLKVLGENQTVVGRECYFALKTIVNFTNLTFFRDSWRQKIFFLNIWLFWRHLAHAIRLVSSLFKYLAEKCY